MHHRIRRVLAAGAAVATIVTGTIAIRPAEAAPRAFSSPVTGALTTPLLPVAVPLPALATFSGTVDESARTVRGTISAPPIEFPFDPSALPIAIDGLPDAEIVFKLQLVTPAPGLTGSWTPGGAATLTGNLRVDIGSTTIGGLPIGLIGGCYYELPLQLAGTVNTTTGVLDVTDDDIVTPGVTGLCAALLGALDEYIAGQEFGFSMRVDLGAFTTPPTPTQPSTPSTGGSTIPGTTPSSVPSTAPTASVPGGSTPTSAPGTRPKSTPAPAPAPAIATKGSVSYVG